MSAQIASSSPLPELPPEIWLNIFRIATFLPNETDLPATTIEPGLFCSYNGYQARAFERVLPLRLSIVLVSRRFYQIGAEVLYTTFYFNPHLYYPHRRVSRFADLLVSRPELGRFIRRLSLQSNSKEESNYQIINRCPNLIIFTSFLYKYDLGHSVPWWRGGLPKTIRSFDAEVDRVATSDITRLLKTLPHLEILHLSSLMTHPIPLPPIRLPALRTLSVCIYHEVESPHSILSTIQLPRLTALGAIGTGLSLPLEVWQGLEYFKPEDHAHIRVRPDYFRNLRHLHLMLRLDVPEKYLKYFPFHQLECLTLGTKPLAESEWERAVDQVVGLPLDATAMPKLKLFQLDWSYDGTYEFYCKRLDDAEAKDRFIRYFETLTARFEQRGVLFVETNYRKLGFQPMRDILSACTQSYTADNLAFSIRKMSWKMLWKMSHPLNIL